MRSLLVSLALISLTMVAPVSASQIVYGVGASTCVWLLENHHNHKSAIRTYLNGYLTASNLWSITLSKGDQKAPQMNLDSDVLARRVLEECRNRPTIKIHKAIENVILDAMTKPDQNR